MKAPAHLGIILDGNGRWATQQGKSRRAGHMAGADAAKQIVQDCISRDIQYLTLYAFSKENWGRPSFEVSALMEIFSLFLQKGAQDLIEKNVKVCILGDLAELSSSLQSRLKKVQEDTKSNTGLQLPVALNYSGQWEIVNAVQRLLVSDDSVLTSPEKLTPAHFSDFMPVTLPPIDLLIRTGNVKRLSNFMLWHMSYAEIYFTDCLWPDFTSQELDQAIAFYTGVERRFGRTPQQIGDEDNA